MNNIYQEINLTYRAYPVDGMNHKSDVNINLTNDYSLEDIFDAFVEFMPCLGFDLTRHEVMKKLKEYTEGSLPIDYFDF